MKPIVAIIAQGSMGAALAGVLTSRGARVITSLAGRSSASSERAKAAGMEAVALADLAQAALVLSIVPPANALPFARQLAPMLASATNRTVFVDCNAVSPATAREIGDVMHAAGIAFVDGGIIGMPPKPSEPGPRLYLSGPNATRVLCLTEYGLDVRIMDRPNGAASALKMSYAGITKGLIAVASAMILGAKRDGVMDMLSSELRESDPVLLKSLSQRVLAMPSRAYRWVDEMRQIEQFVAADPAAAEIYRGAAQLYSRLAEDFSDVGSEVQYLTEFASK